MLEMARKHDVIVKHGNSNNTGNPCSDTGPDTHMSENLGQGFGLGHDFGHDFAHGKVNYTE